MNSQVQAPKATLETLLKELKLKSIEELVSGDAFNIDALAKTTSLHPIIIRSKIALLHTLLTKRPQPEDSQNTKVINLKAVFQRWKSEQSETEQSFPDIAVGENDILQILGRVGAGKSVLLNQIVVECLKKQIEVIFLDGSNNLNALLYRIQQEKQTQKNSSFSSVPLKLRHFSYKNQSELLMILHSIGEWSSNNPEVKPWIIIDCLGRSDDNQSENPQASSTIEFKSAEKIRKLFFQLSLMVGAIIYTTKTLNLSSLFETIYKHEKHRPRGAGSCAKKWDNLANKTICVDFGRTINGQEHLWVNSSKGLECGVFKLKRFE